MSKPIPIVDSHIHLFPASHLPTLAWHGPQNPLGAQHSVDEYRQATTAATTSTPSAAGAAGAAPSYLRGFIFLETDRISSVEEESEKLGWSHPLDEVSLLTRIITGTPVPGEGHAEADRQLCLGMVPWAPVPGGAAVLERYMGLVRERTGEDVYRKVCGVRYLVQDKPKGVMGQAGFVEGLRWLGRQGLAFDLGVDARQGGMWQLREAAEMLRGVFDDRVEEGSRVKVVINHLCKPNLRLPYHGPASVATHPDFLEWSSLIMAMAQYPSTFMKLSGGFSELLPLEEGSEPDVKALVDRMQPWTDVVFDVFGPQRVMFGSDWPVCNVGGGGNAVSWGRWRRVVDEILDRRGLSQAEREGVWGGVAVQAYGVEV
ncbi:amidohydrolase family protein [Aspergillus japonicus CBS 114.51]|uniref:Amidohydrolase family protein n=1 Tax=Aspergillus japonicus CBS 114.51 TaxID=1448312 RepID=A0A8T8XG09_ASPJA|nr:amidohydrolase family protein [Aspergillus japonicus CBS 114.51]RAH87125.1 amidohydrolase family protein [Aspergillus japonicus CBS 114.51]